MCSTYPSSLGLHPALYFYSRSGVFQPQALLAFIQFFKTFDTEEFKQFARVRGEFEEFMMRHRGITEAVRKLGSGSRSRPRVVQLYSRVFAELGNGTKLASIVETLAKSEDFGFLFEDEDRDVPVVDDNHGTPFKRDTKGAAFLRDALPTALRCKTCGGLMHKNSIQTGHQKAKREGGKGQLDNSIMQHPFCNSTFRQ